MGCCYRWAAACWHESRTGGGRPVRDAPQTAGSRCSRDGSRCSAGAGQVIGSPSSSPCNWTGNGCPGPLVLGPSCVCCQSTTKRTSPGYHVFRALSRSLSWRSGSYQSRRFHPAARGRTPVPMPVARDWAISSEPCKCSRRPPELAFRRERGGGHDCHTENCCHGAYLSFDGQGTGCGVVFLSSIARRGWRGSRWRRWPGSLESRWRRGVAV